LNDGIIENLYTEELHEETYGDIILISYMMILRNLMPGNGGNEEA
jgi:hypothetical protein